MKRLTSLVVLGTAALLISPSLYAQRGMAGRGGGGGGFHSGGGFRSAPSGGFRSAPSGGFRSGGPAGFRSAPGGFRSGPGFNTFGPRTSGSSFAPGARTFSSRTVVSSNHVFVSRPFGFSHFHNHFHNHFGFGHGCFGFGCSPFFFSGGFFLGAPFYPYYPGFYDSGYYGDNYSYPPPVQQPVVVNSDNGNSAVLASQVQQLTDEVADLRSEENRRYYEDRARASSGENLSAKEPAAATIFVFTDGHRISAKSYAIAGPTLWIFNEQSAHKYPLADLDASATEQANAANGVEFHVPATKH
ncbi:MAG TPA: hypothetical protein VGK21_17085 [Candidatus Angelobacter sp.]